MLLFPSPGGAPLCDFYMGFQRRWFVNIQKYTLKLWQVRVVHGNKVYFSRKGWIKVKDQEKWNQCFKTSSVVYKKYFTNLSGLFCLIIRTCNILTEWKQSPWLTSQFSVITWTLNLFTIIVSFIINCFLYFSLARRKKYLESMSISRYFFRIPPPKFTNALSKMHEVIELIELQRLVRMNYTINALNKTLSNDLHNVYKNNDTITLQTLIVIMIVTSMLREYEECQNVYPMFKNRNVSMIQVASTEMRRISWNFHYH